MISVNKRKRLRLRALSQKKKKRQHLEFYCDKQRHLICVPYSIPNLHRMAGILRIRRNWFHGNHYDIPKKMIPEVQKKCTILSPKDVLRIIFEGGGVHERLPRRPKKDKKEQ